MLPAQPHGRPRLVRSPRAEQRVLPPGSGCRAAVPGAADQAGATATGLCRRPPRPPGPLWSAGLHAAARGFWTAAGTPRNAEKRDSPYGTPPAPSPTPRPRRKRQSRERRSAGTCHHVSSFCRGRNREEPGGARRGEPAKAPPPPPRWDEACRCVRMGDGARTSHLSHLSHAKHPVSHPGRCSPQRCVEGGVQPHGHGPCVPGTAAGLRAEGVPCLLRPPDGSCP